MLDRSSSSLLPRLPPHRPSAAVKTAYQDKVEAFCATILELERKYGACKLEADALLKVPELGRELCRQAILNYAPASTPRRYLAKLRPYRAEMRQELDRLLKKGVRR